MKPLEFPEFKTFEELHRWSLNNHEQFWARMSKSMISWDKEFTVTGKTFTVDVRPPGNERAHFHHYGRTSKLFDR